MGGVDAIVCDESRDGIVLLHFTRVPSAAEFDAYLALLDGVLARRRRYVVIFDVQTKDAMPSDQRRIQAEWMRKRRDDLQRWCAGTAFVFRSAMYRFVLSSIFLIQPIPTPYEICATVDAALAWASKQLAAA